MNKVFKVIWSEARNAYVVVSEMAKSHGTKSCSTKKLLAMLIATGVMTCASVAPVMAANLAPNDTKIEVGKDAKAKGTDGVAIGKGSEDSAAGWATAIGGDAKATGAYSVALGKDAKSTELQSIAIGNESASSGGSSIAVGTRAKASGGTSIAISQDANASGESSMAFGISSTASDRHTIAIGSIAKALATNAIAIGSQTIADKDNSVAVGPNIQHIGTGAAAVGAQANATGDYSVAMGNLVNVDADWNKNHPGESRKSGSFSVALGSQSGAWGAVSTAVGALSKAEGEQAIAVGALSKAEGEQAIAVGYMSQANVANGTAVGGFSKAEGEYATVLGYAGKASGYCSTALGDYSEVKAGWGVAIGASSFADRESGVIGLYAPDEDKDSLTWKATKGAVSVGSATITRQITNVAAGSEDTDAVNVAQLKAVKAAAGKKVSLVDGENTKATLVKDDATGTQYKVDVDLSKYAKTEYVAVVYDKNKTSLRSTNAGVEDNSIALGKDTYAAKDSVAIGNGASVVVGSNGSGGVALGNKAHAGYKGTSLGSSAISGREGATLVGANTNSASLYTTVIGTDSVINSDGTSYKVKIDTLLGTYEKDVNIQGATATLVGTSNKVDNKNKLVYSGVANNVMGAANTIEASNGVTIQGSGNTVTDAYKDMNISTSEGLKVLLGDYSVLAGKESGAVAVIGGANTVSKQTDSTVIGYDNQLAGDEKKGSHDVFMAGSHNRLNNVSDSIVMGNKNVITGVSNVISFGHDNKIKASNAVAIGNGAGVSVEGGVALGVGSVASTAANALGYGADGKTDATWQATKGAVSVGGNGVTRQITNVAAGTEDTDAVNVAQLKKVSDTANAGWNLSTNGVGTEATKVKPGDYVDFSGDDENITVSKEENEYATLVKVNLNRDLNVDSVHAGDFFMNNDMGIGFGGSAYITKNGLNANDKVITNVAAGVYNTDAVNVGQLKKVEEVAANANKGWNLATNGFGTEATNVKPGDYVDFSGDKNISVSHDGTKVQVELNKNIDVNYVQTNALNAKYNLSVGTMAENGIMPFLVNSTGAFYAANNNFSVDKDGKVIATAGEIGNVVLQNGVYTGNSTLRDGELYVGDASGNYSQITTTGAKLGQVTIAADGKISGVAAGEADTDAVNVSQLKEAVEAGNTDTHIKPGEYGVGADNTVNMDVVDKNGNKVDTVTIKDVAKASDVGNVNDIADDLKNGGEGKTTVVDAVNNLNQKLDNKVGDLNYVEGGKGNYVTNGENTTTSIGKLDQALKDVAATAAKHTTVTQGDNITVTPGTNTDGSKNYNVALKKDITVESVTANTFKADQTVMDKDGLKVGDKVSVSATAVTAGQTSINNDGLAVGPNTSLKADELKVDGKTYIDKNGLNANGMQITNVADGKENSDAVNVGQLKESEKTINNRIDGVENQVVNNTNRINKLGSRVNKVGAGAAALAALHPMDFDPDDKLTFSAGYGNYGGENAAAIGAYYRPDEKVMFSVAGTVGNGENMVNAGVSFALDRTNHVSNSRTALAREVIDLRGQLAVMGAKMAKMEKAFGMLDETKTKLFPDVPANHWAYEYIAKLAGNGYIEGYPDGNFGGDRLMTRYEFAAMLYRAIENGAALEEKIIKEFEPELGRIRVDRISGEDGDRDKIERVRVNDTKGERDHYGNKLAK